MKPAALGPHLTAWCSLTVAALTLPHDLHATARRTLAPVTTPARHAAPAPPAPPPPLVPLQIGGLRVLTPVAQAAVMHAIQRDVWPLLLRCVSASPRARGYVNVEITEHDADTIAVRAVGAPIARDASLATCVRQAVAQIVLPPYDDPPPPVSVTFDLAFGMPALGAHR